MLEQHGGAAYDGGRRRRAITPTYNPWHSENDDEGEEEWDPWQLDHFYTIKNVKEKRNESRNTRMQTTTFSIHDWEEAYNPERLFENIIAALQKRLFDTNPGTLPSLIGMEMKNPIMRTHFYLPTRPLEQNTPEAMAAAFECLQQSDDELELYDHPLTCRMFGVWPLVERAGCSRQQHRVTNRVSSLVVVENPDDELCLLRAITIGMKDVGRRNGTVGELEYMHYIRPNSVQ